MRPASRAALPRPVALLRAGGGAMLFLAASAVLIPDAVALPPRPSAGGDAGGAPLSRQELMHQFDLDFDGRIDPSEADMARSKMRLKRMEQMRRDRIDPITGRRRGEIEDEKAGKDGGRAAGREPRKPILGIDDLLEANDPGRATTRVEVGKDRRAATPWKRGGKAASADTGTERAKERSAAPTGGVRAGAPPARPGYGAPGVPKETKPLNAGRPIGSPLPGSPAAAVPGGAPASGNAPRGAARPPAGTRPGQPPATR